MHMGDEKSLLMSVRGVTDDVFTAETQRTQK